MQPEQWQYRLTRNSRRFNPHPARRQDATFKVQGNDKSIGVSILILLGGRMQPKRLSVPPINHLFQSSSCSEAGCNLSIPLSNGGSELFQSSSCSEAGCNTQAGRAAHR